MADNNEIKAINKTGFAQRLREYKRKTYNELLKHEYPITDLVTIEKDTLSIE